MIKSVAHFVWSLFLLGIFFLNSCSAPSEAQKIIDKSIQAHGGDLYQKAEISFDFRDRHYVILKTPDRFEYSREFSDSTGLVKDVLNKHSFVRTINGEVVDVVAERAVAFSNSLNGVAYFAFLPYGLNDRAVYKAYLGETEIEGKGYHLIKVTFSEDGGGVDFEDEFLYWINRDNFRVDYLAYSYLTEGGGLRFRKAINPRIVEGILIQDYENYQPNDKNIALENLEELYKNGELELLSEIILENVQVTLLEE